MGCASATDSKDTDDPVVTAHDGDAGAPLTLTLGQVWSGKVGGEDSTEESSFYTFNSGDNTSLMVEVTNSSLPHDSEDVYYDVWLWDGNTASGDLSDSLSAQDSVAPIFQNLKPNTNYTIELENYGTDATTYQIQVKALPATANEGSVAAPVVLTLGQTHAGYTTYVNGGESYYAFNTGNHTSVTISYTHPRLSSTVYQSSSFATTLDWELSPMEKVLTVANLQANTDYYLALDFSWFSGDYRCTFDLTVTGN